MSLRIDAHQHYWDPARGDYGWLTPDLGLLHRPYGPDDLAPALARCAIDRTVLVQAAPTVAETDWLLALADRTPSVAGVVGWIDFERPQEMATFERLAAHPRLVGLRPMIQDIADAAWIERTDLDWAFAAMTAKGLVFDALTLPRHLPHLLRRLSRHPELRVVIDHGSKPQIRDGAFDDWAMWMRRLARETGAAVKLSGLVTEAAPGWTGVDLARYVELLLEAFGPRRMLFGSDWPVCLLASSYERWIETAEGFLAHLDERARADVMGGVAARLYGLAKS
ncbi:MAG: amidohydrolase family protein [Methylobacteriaceae bacterium]|nr:amidohydrolase family protein [Methylobacteriaceae bacterium]